MKLTQEERRMLDGTYGDQVASAMVLLTKLGEAYDAEKLIDIRGAHLFAWKINGEMPGDVVLGQIEQMAGGATLRVPCTTNPVCLNPDLAERLDIPRDMAEEHGPNIAKLQQLCKNIGAIPTYSCHFHYPFQPKLGDSYALTESNVCMFANAWYGIRSNMEGDLTALAAAIVGKTPYYGMHLAANRRGRVLVRLSEDMDPYTLRTADFGAISYHAGKVIADDRIPVYDGFPQTMGPTQVKYMQPQIANTSAPLFHIVGVTPEAPTLEAAFGGKVPREAIHVGRRELIDAYERLNTTDKSAIDIIAIGCPHCTLEEIRELASLLEGRRISANLRVLIGTSSAVGALAHRMGLAHTIERAGGILLTDMCTVGILLLGLIREWNIRYVATNSACAASICAEHPAFVPGIDIRFGSTRQCVRAALTGRWEESNADE